MADAGIRNVQGVYRALGTMTMRVAQAEGRIRARASECKSLLELEDEVGRAQVAQGPMRGSAMYEGSGSAQDEPQHYIDNPKRYTEGYTWGAPDVAKTQQTLRKTAGGHRRVAEQGCTGGGASAETGCIEIPAAQRTT